MKITKLAHCAMIIEEKGVRILTDPGSYSIDEVEAISGEIDALLITHEHRDHYHSESIKRVVAANPEIKIISNKAVQKLLKNDNFDCELVENKQVADVKGVIIEGFGEKHADIYKEIVAVQNTGYFISNRFFYPGDAFTYPGKDVEILALPVSAPWLKISESIEYGLEIKPNNCFPVHDWNLKTFDVYHTIPKRFLEPQGIRFIIPEGEMEF